MDASCRGDDVRVQIDLPAVKVDNLEANSHGRVLTAPSGGRAGQAASGRDLPCQDGARSDQGDLHGLRLTRVFA